MEGTGRQNGGVRPRVNEWSKQRWEGPGTDKKYPISESNDTGTEPIVTGHVSSLPRKSLVKGLPKELEIDESYLEKLAAEVRKDLG